MKKFVLYIILNCIFLVSSIVVSVAQNNVLYVIIAASLSAIIPMIISFMSFGEGTKVNFSARKNRFSDDTFTDRKDDVAIILHKLNNTNKAIEITSSKDKCGKTWLAKKICDYINFPHDESSNTIYKRSYKKAYYIDMQNNNNTYIDNFFEHTHINKNVVMIFDHVADINYILSKQKLYDFYLIYILNNICDNNVEHHIISSFKEEHIDELQKKLHNRYSKIDNLIPEEISILYNLTDGIIGKIATILSRQEYIIWVKQISHNEYTDYEQDLNEIQIDLYCGFYREASKKLDLFENNYKQSIDLNNDLKFKFLLTKSDCEHLLNNYEYALDILSMIDGPSYNFDNVNYIVELRKAHYFKHLWRCNDALETLQSIQSKSYSAIVDALGILLAKYFINDLYVPNKDNTSKKEFFRIFGLAKFSSLPKSESDTLKFERYQPVYEFYRKAPKDNEALINSISRIIDIYSAQNNRLLANAFFVRGEIYRMYHEFGLAENDYMQSIMITDDLNIKIQVYMIRYYIYNIKKIKKELDVEVPSLEKLAQMCRGKNHYGELLFNRINCIILNDPNANEIINHFDTRIMPIL